MAPDDVSATVPGDVSPAATADVAVAGPASVEKAAVVPVGLPAERPTLDMVPGAGVAGPNAGDVWLDAGVVGSGAGNIEPRASEADAGSIEAASRAAESEPDVIGPREPVPHSDRFSEWTPDANEAAYDLDAPLSARPRTRTTVASRRAPRESRARRLVMAAAAVALLAIGGGVGAFWWQSRAGAGPPGTLEVSSEPPGTEVRIDGEPRGKTPLTLELRPGRYRVEVRAFGDVREATVDVAPGQSLTQSFSLALPSLTGSLEVTSRAANVEVVVDGLSRGVAPLTVADLPIGIHTVTLKSPRGEARHEVTIEAAKTAEHVITIELDPAAQDMVRYNPWSRSLFDNPKITQIVGDAFEVVPSFEDGAFSCILHDPPMLSLAGELYSGEFYRDCWRVLRRNGRLFHYIGDPDSKSGARTTKGVVRRLQEAGFTRVIAKPQAFGVAAYK